MYERTSQNADVSIFEKIYEIGDTSIHAYIKFVYMCVCVCVLNRAPLTDTIYAYYKTGVKLITISIN